MKRYLGDGVYAEFDGYAIWLSTHNGLRETNRIALEPEVCQTLAVFIKDLGKVTEPLFQGRTFQELLEESYKVTKLRLAPRQI